MTTADLAPLLLGLARGYFRDAGFTFDQDDLIVAASGRTSADLLASGDADIAYATYVPLIADGEADANGVQLIQGASAAGPGSCLVVAMPDSGIGSVRDLRGARVAVTAKGTISDLLVRSTLRENGVDPDSVEWFEMPFAEMIHKLESHDIDAAFMTDPFLSHAQAVLDVVTVFDAASGPFANIPTAGFGTTTAFADTNPNTVAAFRRVMNVSTREALADWRTVVPLLEDFANIPRNVARSASLLTLHPGLEPDQVQRVADLMVTNGGLGEEFDVRRLLHRRPLLDVDEQGLWFGRPAFGVGAGTHHCRRVRGARRRAAPRLDCDRAGRSALCS
jgi:NitT/TauT family transport system substrate-binding protein